jgi:hypothetical protein
MEVDDDLMGCARSNALGRGKLESLWERAKGNTRELTVNGLMLLWEGGDV